MELIQRKNHRLKDFDYGSNGYYFVTICTQDRLPILSKISRGDPCGRPGVTVTQLGEIAEQTIGKIESLHQITIDKYVIMPNHIHIILVIDGERATARVAPTVGRIIGSYKSIIATQWLQICKCNNITMGKLWQRSFYDRIVRNEQEYQDISQYIDTNPLNWQDDELYYQK